MLTNVTFQRISEYARITGKPVSVVLNEAVNDFMDMTGDLIIDEIKRRQQSNREQAKILTMIVGQ